MRFTLAVATLLTPLALVGQGLYLGPNPKPSDPQPQTPPIQSWPTTPGPVSIRTTRLQVQASIHDGIATTEVRQTFRNDGGGVGEATWLLPLPAGAAADRFAMTVDGKETSGEVLDAGKARQVYEDIVRQRRDPGLLEYLGHGCLRARVFPIPAQGEVTVLVRFRVLLVPSGGLYEWSWPVRSAAAGGQAGDKVSLDVKITSSTPLKGVYSPLPGVDIRCTGDREARVSLELDRGQIPERDLSVFYGLSEQDFGLHLLTFRRPGEPGWFLMLLAPKQDWPASTATRKAITFALDTSGSMQGKKIEQARQALRFFLQSLQPGDWFNVVPFSTEARPFFPAPVPADRDHIDAALARSNELEARGGTNIEDALRQALTIPPAPAGATVVPITVFLTDGLPTVGVTEVEALLRHAQQHNTAKARVFVFGVGSDVNTRLLDRIAADSRGDRDYVREDENLEIKTGALFTKLSHPVMTGVELLADGVDGFDLFPRQTPDLFKGSHLLVAGRYRGEGAKAIRLRGTVDGVVREYVFEGTFPAQDQRHDFVSVLWAERKIGYLLDQIRLHGQKGELTGELTAEIARLGKEFGIATPYTSHLILEEGMRVASARGFAPTGPASPGPSQALGDDRQHARLRDELRRAGALPPATAGADEPKLEVLLTKAQSEAEAARGKLDRAGSTETGKEAVDLSLRARVLSVAAAPSATAPSEGRAAQLLQRRVKDRTFYLANGVWIDMRFTAALQDKVRKIAAFSPEYFKLLDERPELAGYFAFSARMLVLVDGAPVEVE